MLHTMTSAAFVRSPSVLRDRFWSAFVAERERWVLWLPVALGIGVAVYFALPREPVWFSGLVLLAVSLAGLITVRRGSLLRLTMVLVLFSGVGFSAAQWRTHKVAASVLAEAQITTALEGRVVTVEPAARGPRMVLDRVSFMGTDTSAPERVRVRLRATDEGVRPGDQLRVRTAGVAHLSNLQESPFVRDIWQRRLRVVEFVPFTKGEGGLSCDVLGCIGKLGVHAMEVVKDARSFEEECRRANILISAEPIPRNCTGPAVTIGRFDVWRSGAHASATRDARGCG
jgi:hypothetical protein